jgi:nicotinamidase-related amidase
LDGRWGPTYHTTSPKASNVVEEEHLVPDFPIEPARTALLFFDALKIYLDPDDPGDRAAVDASGVVPAMQRINSAARQVGIAVFYAQADHRPDYRDFSSHVVDQGYWGKPGDPAHRTSAPAVVSGLPGAEIIDAIAPQDGDYVIKKHRWNTFFQTHFELSLRTAGIDTIMIAGGATEVGVASTAYAARDLDFNQIILRDACLSLRPDGNDYFCGKVFPMFARVMTVDQAIAKIE